MDPTARQVATAKRVASRFASEERYARLFLAMSLQEAKAVLGFPPGAIPSPEEVSKAYKVKALENHPDRGGSHEKMVEVNVAKDLLLGKGKPTPDAGGSAGDWVRDWYKNSPGGTGGGYQQRQKREPPPVVETIPGDDFGTAVSKAGAPTTIEWKCVSKPVYAVVKEKRAWNSDIWTLVGVTDQKFWVLSVKLRLGNTYFDADRNGNVQVDPGWQANLVSLPRNKDPLKILPKLVRSPSVLFEDGTVADPPKKWVVWEGGRLTEHGVKRVKGSGGAALKDVLAMTGIVSGEAAGVSGRKSVVEMIPRYNKAKAEQLRKEQGGKVYAYQLFDYEVRVNGKSDMLSADTIKNLEKNHFIMAVFDYNPSDGVAKQLSKLRGSRLRVDASTAIRMLADSLTGEPSWLIIALEKAAEEWEVESAKSASYDDE